VPRIIRIVCASALLLSLGLHAQRNKKNEEPVTQTLEVLPDPPSVLTAETTRLIFSAPPATVTGLLSQQARDQVKWILNRHRQDRVIKIRAFVAGSGDLRRIQSVVSELFAEKRMSLPVLSVALVGSLPGTGAQVQMEVTAEQRKPVNPNGLAFIAGQLVEPDKPDATAVQLAGASLARVKSAMEAAGAPPASARRVTCFTSSLDGAAEVRQAALTAFPQAAFTIVQSQRGYTKPLVECEAVAAPARAPASIVARINPPGFPPATRYSHAVATSAPKLVFAGSQLAFNFTDADAKLAFDRLEKNLASAGSSLKRTVMLNVYPLSPTLADLVRKYWFEYLDQSGPPASTLMVLEGLPSMDAAFALEAVALPLDPASAK
jgi:enamine deaminase RidA (YjgF/YER057c/UK114 family)